MAWWGSCPIVILKVSQIKSLRRGQVGSVSGLEATSQSSCLFGPVAPGRELAAFAAPLSDTGISLQLWLQLPVLNQSPFPCRTLTGLLRPTCRPGALRICTTSSIQDLGFVALSCFSLSLVMAFYFTIFNIFFSRYSVFEAKGARMGIQCAVFTKKNPALF